MEKEMQEIQRTSNFELLRILSIMMIVFSHFFVHGGFPKTNELTWVNVLFNSCRIGEIGVTCFVLISGYFLVDKCFSLRKLLKLAFQIWFYGVVLLSLCYICGIGTITNKIVWKSILPFYSTNWFAQAYIVLYLAFPFLNKFIRKLSQRAFIWLLLFITFAWYIVPAFSFYTYGNMRITVIIIYLFGAYLKLYYPSVLAKKYICIALIVFSSIGILFGTYGVTSYLLKHPEVTGRLDMFMALNSIFVLTSGLGWFCLFKNLQLRYLPFVNYIAPTAFGIYLIHENALLKKWLWIDTLKIDRFDGVGTFGYAIFCVLIICIVCSIIDLLRLKYVETPIMKMFKGV